MHSDFSYLPRVLAGTLYQKLSRFPTRNACADAENKWFDLTGRVVVLKVETDGDIDIALIDATGDKPRTVVVEIPAKPQWCEIRNMVFSWTRTRFSFHTSSAKKLNVTDPPIITVIGKAYFDVGHAPKDQSNWRKYLPDYAAWEIHPVMKIEFSNQAERHFSIHCS